jgi:hypothetical protein
MSTFHLPISQAFLKNSDCGQITHLCTLASNVPHVMVRSEYTLLNLRLDEVNKNGLSHREALARFVVTYFFNNSLSALP